MRRVRLLLRLVVVAVVVGGWSAAMAHAGPVWMVKGSKLGSGETASANLKFGKLTIKWEDSGTKTKFEVECQKATGEAELKGGNPGKDGMRSLKIKECVLLKGGTGCELAAGASTEELPGWATELEEKSAKVYDTISGTSFSVLLEGCEKASFSKTWLFRGTVKIELTNETGKLKAILPVGGVTGDTLKSEGAEATISGEGTMEEKLGGTLETKIEPPASGLHWYSGETKLSEGTPLNIVSSGGVQVLKGTAGGTTIEIKCQHLDDSGTITNPTGGGAGVTLKLLLYLECTVPKPAIGCTIANEMIHVHMLGVLLGTNALPEVEFMGEAEGGKQFVKITLASCALAGEYPVTGTILGMIKNATSTVTVNEVKGSKSMVEFSATEAGLTGEDKVEMEGGGLIEAKE